MNSMCSIYVKKCFVIRVKEMKDNELPFLQDGNMPCLCGRRVQVFSYLWPALTFVLCHEYSIPLHVSVARQIYKIKNSLKPFLWYNFNYTEKSKAYSTALGLPYVTASRASESRRGRSSRCNCWVAVESTYRYILKHATDARCIKSTRWPKCTR